MEVFSKLPSLSLALYISGALNVILVNSPKSVIDTGAIVVLLPSIFVLKTLYLFMSVLGALNLNVNVSPL